MNKASAVTLLVLAGALLAWGYVTQIKPRAAHARAQISEHDARARARLAQWATIGHESKLSEAETLRQVRIPDPVDPGNPVLDRSCYVYTHSEYRQAQMLCPGDDMAWSEPGATLSH